MVMEIVVSVILLFVGIAVLVVIHACIVGRAFGRVNHGAMMLSMARAQRETTASNKRIMSMEDLKMIPCFDYGAVSERATPADCAVCLESFKEGEKCRLLPLCSHSFHAQCIDSWLLKAPICPICRTCVKPKRSEN